MYLPVLVYRSRMLLTSLIAGALVAILCAILYLWNSSSVNHVLRDWFYYLGTRGIELSLPIGTPSDIVIMLIFGVIAFLIAFMVSMATLSYYPSVRASSRANEINSMLPYSMTFMYAMSKGGSNPLDVFKSLSEHREVYGEMAVESAAIIKGVELLGYDLITSVKNVSATTPSEPLKNFLESSVSITESGGSFTKFLYAKISQSREVAAMEQKSLLEMLGLMAEVYVTGLVAGPLFIIVVMVVIGMMGSMNMLLMELLVYGLIPIGSIGFVIILDIFGLLEDADHFTLIKRELKAFKDIKVDRNASDEPKVKPDLIYRFKKFMEDPFKPLIQKPHTILYATIPVAAIALAYGFFSQQFTSLFDLVSGMDDYALLSFAIAAVPFAIVWEVKKRQVRKIDAQVPEFLKRLASINESGLTIDKAIKTLVTSNLGVLNTEVKRIVSDLDWGAGVKEALVRFEYRVNTFSIRRLVTLIVRASDSAGNIKDTLHIAADEANSSNNLKEERLADMLVYVAIIYISFFVFLYIVFVLSSTFLPMMPTATSLASGTASGSSAASSGMVNQLPISYSIHVDTIKLLLYHSILVQALFSGIIAGIMGEGSIYSGLKHSLIMMAIAYVAFILFL